MSSITSRLSSATAQSVEAAQEVSVSAKALAQGLATSLSRLNEAPRSVIAQHVRSSTVYLEPSQRLTDGKLDCCWVEIDASSRSLAVVLCESLGKIRLTSADDFRRLIDRNGTKKVENLVRCFE